MRHPLRRLRETAMFDRFRFGSYVEASTYSIYEPATVQKVQVLARYIMWVQVPGPQHTSLLDEFQYSICR